MEDRLLDLLRALAAEDVTYAIFGGVAVNLHGIIRATEDVDLFLDPSEENVARLHRALRRLWDDPALDEITADDLLGDYPAVRYGSPDGMFIDVVTRLGTAFRYEDLETEIVDLEGVPVRVVTPATLYRMKRDTVRPRDRNDAADLAAKFRLEEG